MKTVTLSEAIQDLRKELLAAMRGGADEELKFKIGEIELELQLEVSHEAKGSGKVSWFLFQAEAGASRNDSRVHTLRLKLEPVGPNNGPFKVSKKRGAPPK